MREKDRRGAAKGSSNFAAVASVALLGTRGGLLKKVEDIPSRLKEKKNRNAGGKNVGSNVATHAFHKFTHGRKVLDFVTGKGWGKEGKDLKTTCHWRSLNKWAKHGCKGNNWEDVEGKEKGKRKASACS